MFNKNWDRYMNNPLYLFAIVLSALLYACGGISSSDDPELNRFEIIDTDGSDSATADESEISLSASENDGEFELYWDINTDDDYNYEVRINDDNELSGSLLLFSDLCDPDNSCHNNQNLECEYQSDLEIVCEDSSGDERTTDFSSLIDEDDLPENLFFIIEACDPFGFDCEDQAIEVEFQ